MRTEIYYFSATGNSLSVARDIAEKINGKLISIPSLMEEKSTRSEVDVIGIVFPVYYATNDCGIPLIVRRFVNKLGNLSSKYIFAVCTHQGAPGTTIENLAKIVKSCGGELAVGFKVKMSYSYSVPEKIRHSLFHKELVTDSLEDNEKQQKLFDDWKKKIEGICEYVTARKTGKFETRSLLLKTFLAPFHPIEKLAFLYRYRKLSNMSHLPFNELIPLADKSFKTNKNCNGCGTCTRVCPVNNITIVKGKPVWLHHCENCFGCFQWCPREAIHGGIVEYAKKYHNPKVKLSDMLRATNLK